MTSGRDAAAAAMSLRSAIPGRERWHVPSLVGRTEEAADVAARLSASPEIVRAKASGVTGSVIVEFAPALAPLRVRSLISSAVTAALEEERRPRAVAQRDPHTESAAQQLYRIARPHRPTLIAATLLTIVERFHAAIAPLFAMWGVNILASGASATLTSMGVGTVTMQLIVTGGCLALAAAMAFVAHEAAHTLWGRLADLIEGDLRDEAKQEYKAMVREFFSQHLPALIGYVVHTGTITGASVAVFRRSALLILIPATVFGTLSTLRPRHLLVQDEESRIPLGVREWFRLPHFVTLAMIGASAGLAWRLGWVTLDVALLLLFFGELRIAPAMTVGHHIHGTRAAIGAARELEAGTPAEVPA